MSALTEILGDDLIKDSRTDINNNFDALNDEKIETSYLDTDTTLAANSDTKIPTQKAVKAYVDSGGNPNASETQAGISQEATDLQVTNGSSTGSTGAKLFVTPAKLATRFLTKSTQYVDSTQVFSGTAPTTYTDLDLSAVIGANQKMVMLKVTSPENGAITFRRNGDTSDYHPTGNTGEYGGVCSCNLYGTVADQSGMIIVKTDTSGVVEWFKDDADAVVINVESYW
jgi:hypothetical protein